MLLAATGRAWRRCSPTRRWYRAARLRSPSTGRRRGRTALACAVLEARDKARRMVSRASASSAGRRRSGIDVRHRQHPLRLGDVAPTGVSAGRGAGLSAGGDGLPVQHQARCAMRCSHDRTPTGLEAVVERQAHHDLLPHLGRTRIRYGSSAQLAGTARGRRVRCQSPGHAGRPRVRFPGSWQGHVATTAPGPELIGAIGRESLQLRRAAIRPGRRRLPPVAGVATVGDAGGTQE